MAKPLSFGSPEVKSTLKVLGWSVGSAVVVFLLDLLQVVDIPVQFLPYVPVANTILYALKEFFTNRS